MTHTQRVLALLSDGKPHSYREGYRLGVMLHSRVADLRKQGYRIECDKSGGDFVYRLLSSAGVRADGAGGQIPVSKSSSKDSEPADSVSPSAVVVSPSTYAEPPALRSPSPELAAGQLTLDAA